jgi:hypothetical protein
MKSAEVLLLLGNLAAPPTSARGVVILDDPLVNDADAVRNQIEQRAAKRDAIERERRAAALAVFEQNAQENARRMEAAEAKRQRKAARWRRERGE